jgi:hypothetical protein
LTPIIMTMNFGFSATIASRAICAHSISRRVS